MTDAVDAPAAAPPRRRRWVWIALIVSLAVNLLALGVVVGTGWTRWTATPVTSPRAFSFSRTMEAMIAEAPDDRRPALRAILDRYQSEVRPMWRQIREARTQAVEALRAEPLDETQAREALDRLYALQHEARQRIGGLTLDLSRNLSVEQRQAVLETFGARRWQGQRRGERGSER